MTTPPTTDHMPHDHTSRPALRQSAYNVWVEHDDGDAHVFNGVSGRLEHTSLEERSLISDWLQGDPVPATAEGMLTRLVEARVLVPTAADELDLLRSRFRSAAHDTSHLGLTIVTSMGCNFDCPYCFESKTPALLRDDVADRVFELLDERIDELETFRVCWYGGEPLLGKDRLIRLAGRLRDRCDDGGIEHSSMIVTNGWLLDGETAAALAAVGVGIAQVTLDGPPATHDRLRAHVSGAPSFDRVVSNIVAAADHMEIAVRINVDADSIDAIDDVLARLEQAGLAGRIGLGLGHVAPVSHNPDAPSSSYSGPCLTLSQFGAGELAFEALAAARGFGSPTPPNARATPCTAVHRNEMIVGAHGELWKCLDDAGNAEAVIGTVFDLSDINKRVRRWFDFDPFEDPECRTCVAMPVCMGGCALFATTPGMYEHRCSTFREHHRERVRLAVSDAPDADRARAELDEIAHSARSAMSPHVATPVSLRLGPTSRTTESPVSTIGAVP